MEITAGALAEAGHFGIAPVIVGWVRSELKNLENCPHWQDEGPEASIEILPPYMDALYGMEPGQRITLITWLHKSDRTVLRNSKRQRPARGVFCSRSPARPNPIGLHDVLVTGVEMNAERAVINVRALEALDGTPVLDVKIVRAHCRDASGDNTFIEAKLELMDMCRRAGEKGLMPGFSGNASMRVGEYCLVTRSGAAKERLTEDDFGLIRIADGQVSCGARPSSEYPVHLEIYRNQPEARVILHTHPAHLLALGIKRPETKMAERLALPLFEARALCGKLGMTARLAPGSQGLGRAAGRLAQKNSLIWLEGHGLCAWGANTAATLALSEELEHLAKMALLAVQV